MERLPPDKGERAELALQISPTVQAAHLRARSFVARNDAAPKPLFWNRL
jgi:hypothetical protein